MPKLYKVGGCVRDLYLGIDSNDIDYTFVIDDINKSVEEGFSEMTKYLEDNNFKIFLSTPSMFTIRAKFPKGSDNENLVADFVLSRKEIGYVENTRTPILVLGTLFDDLIRRDFTVNAMALDENNVLIDPFNGMIDLRNGILRTPLPAHQTMMDDPLRIIRSLRFSITKNFEIHDDIFNSLKQDGILEKLEKVVSSERIREELLKMFKFDTIQTLSLLNDVENKNPGFMKIIFKNGMHLEPTFKK